MKIPKEFKVDESAMLEEIRLLLGLTIESFAYEMDWPNPKYYNYIKNGRKRSETNKIQKSHPTIYKIFNGINYAIANYDHWKEQASTITALVIKYLLPAFTDDSSK